MAAPHSDISAAKIDLRARMRAVRAGCDPALGADMAAHALAWPFAPGANVSAFWPQDREIDTRPLMHGLHERGVGVLLPVTPRVGQPLHFRRWTPATTLIRERFGTLAPGPDAPEGVPEVMFVPLLAWDIEGHRLGYGGGFYDRTLAGLPEAIAIGCGFAAQRVDAVPAGEYDARLAAVVTERGLLRF